MLKSLLVGLICLSPAPLAHGQQMDFPWTSARDDAATSESIAALAKEVVAVYRDSDDDRYRSNLFRIQTIAGQYAEAAATAHLLRETRQAGPAPQTALRMIPFEI